MKRNFLKILLCLIMTICACTFSSCIWKGFDNVDETGLKTEGYFHFYEYSDHIKVRDFSLEGETLETCYLPAYINDKTVTAVGYTIWISSECRLESENLRYLNVPYGVTETNGFEEVKNLETLIFSSVTPVSHFGGFEPLPNATVKVFVPSTAVTNYEQILNANGLAFEAANISYLFNYDDAPNSGIYMVDYKSVGSKLYKPMDPKKEGFEFDGWFTDSDCTAQWNFEQDSFPATNEIGENKEMKLYAKWKAIS